MDLSEDIAAIAGLEESRARAIVEADATELGRLTDDDYLHIEASGKVRNKDGFLAGVAPKGGRFERYVLLDNQIRVFGDAAVVTGLFENTFVAADGSRTTKRARHTRVYVRRANGWKNVSHQATVAP